MTFKVGVGKSDFEALRKSNNYYVDKTDIMYELVEETDNQVTLFTRPRRFGKTLMMSVLLMTGYITKADSDEEGETVSLKIPNKEIASIFKDTVAVHFRNTTDTAEIDQLIYHAFLSGIFVGRGYHVESNKEKGLGRPDILLKDKKNRRTIIIEAKKSKREADMEKDCEAAISQIVTERYAEGLYGYTQILCYGISFFQKQAKVKKWEADRMRQL